MDFYSVWAEMRQNNIDDTAAIESFLTLSKESVQPLTAGDEQELQTAFEILDEIPIERFIDVAKTLSDDRDMVAADVPCFSTFENGAYRLNELLIFEPNGLSFNEAGYQLKNSVKPSAKKKYGENHSKLAASMSLVTIDYGKWAVINSTNWGQFLIKYDKHKKASVLKKLLLRDICVRTIIKSALQGPTSYREVVSFLALSTAKRRKTNVKCLVEFVLKETAFEKILSRIDWKCR